MIEILECKEKSNDNKTKLGDCKRYLVKLAKVLSPSCKREDKDETRHCISSTLLASLDRSRLLLLQASEACEQVSLLESQLQSMNGKLKIHKDRNKHFTCRPAPSPRPSPITPASPNATLEIDWQYWYLMHAVSCG